ncbi:phosphoglycerate mutase [Parvularcula bermudensis HTCC2503]|uniref:Phosphoglycerate mutase n=1 Tax=Parvularcula bermudensis (strain ATCC BAA-594 / HTCC2503 / KCTC 12087) TaxID=314260 RepID=E0TEN8_PARBH|nr:histidine phosphatase family protein [Parvularcula bermudensis]ADM08921.1 phosphoglycerate mutase [Parvularcula bermudensis HTCC2503]
MKSSSGLTLYLVRHGETVWNRERRMQGQADSPLTKLGRAQAETHADLLARHEVDRIIASPLGRVRETAAVISRRLVVTPDFDDRLMEWSCGDWAGILYSDLSRLWPKEHAAWLGDRYGVRPPGGENMEDLRARAEAFWGEWQDRLTGRVALIGHGLMNRAIAGVLLDLSRAEIMAIRQKNDRIIRLSFTADRPIVHHFAGLRGPLTGLPGERGMTIPVS